MTLTEDQQREIDLALEKEVNDIDDYGVGDDTSEEGQEDEKEETTETEETSTEDTQETKETEQTETTEETQVTKTEAPPAEDKDSIIAELRKQIESQNQAMLDLKSGRTTKIEEEPKKPEAEVKKPSEQNQPSAEAKEEEYKDVDFVGQLDMDDVSADGKILNQILNQVAKTVIDHVSKTVPISATKQTLLAIPNVIQAQIKQQSYIDTMVNTFYQENEDLVPVRYTVGQVAEGIAAEHPEYGIEELFNAAGEKARLILKMPKSAEKKENTKEFENPALAGKTSKRKKPVEISDLQREIDEL